MSGGLVVQGKSGGLVPAVCSWILPGLGQLVNKESEKALGVFVVVAGAGIAMQLPVVGGAAAVVAVGSWLYGVFDAFRGKR